MRRTDRKTQRGISRRAFVTAAGAAPLSRGRCSAAGLRFIPAEGGGFEFDTGVLKGMLHAKGRLAGLLPVTHLPSGASLARSMGLFGVYRVFSRASRYGDGMWYVAGETQLGADGSVTVRWPAAADRPFELTAVYRWSGPGSLDVGLAVRPERALHGFEAFLAAYFEPQFTSSRVLVKGGRFMAAEAANGQWQMFPRDPDAVALIRDGRWKIPPSPVDWAILPEFAQPLAVRRDPVSGLAAAVMSRTEDCFAVATPHQRESHYSTYLSLFGHDIEVGETARARARLVVTSGDERAIQDLYGAYVNTDTGR